MSLLTRLFGDKYKEREPEPVAEKVNHFSESPVDSIDLGWYWSAGKAEFQMAKIPQKDRATHFYIIGATGSGKTKFIEFLIRQDIEKGNGFAVIDPHGDLIEDVKGFLSYHYGHQNSLAEKVVLINPSDPDYTVTFNPLEKLPGVTISEQVNELISAFRKIWSDSWGVRMEDLMRNSLIALGEADLTLIELPRFLMRRDFRKVVLERVTHTITKDYFHRFDSMTDRGQATWVEPVMNKINAFFSDERIRQMFASSTKSSFNIREIMDGGKILLVKLDKGRLKDSSDLLGSLLMAKIQMAAFSRADVPVNKRRPFYLYIDEFQNFASESFMVILSEARKYGLSLIMAHQTLAQVPNELRSLILGNAGIQVYFRVNHQDASVLSKEAFQYSTFEVNEKWEHKVDDLQSLSPRYFFVKHKIEGGIICLQADEIESPWNEVGNRVESDIGRKYMVSRAELSLLAEQRQKEIEEEIKLLRHEKEKEQEPIRKQEQAAELEKCRTAPPSVETKHKEDIRPTYIPKDRKPVSIPIFEGTGGSQHRYIQSLIKRMAEEKGYRAVIEQPTSDGKGKVDIGLEKEETRIAVEISLTTSDDHEVENIKKCLASGFNMVVVCSPDKKVLNKIRSKANDGFNEQEKEKILYLQPEEIYNFLENGPLPETKEETIKGFKVKVNYQAVKEDEKMAKRDAVTQVIVRALQRIKGK
jgi:hypothetical protein